MVCFGCGETTTVWKDVDAEIITVDGSVVNQAINDIMRKLTGEVDVGIRINVCGKVILQDIKLKSVEANANTYGDKLPVAVSAQYCSNPDEDCFKNYDYRIHVGQRVVFTETQMDDSQLRELVSCMDPTEVYEKGVKRGQPNTETPPEEKTRTIRSNTRPNSLRSPANVGGNSGKVLP